ncbi:glycosyltransferase family 2 protein [Telmatocola sphagniphila]|uniref:Glycosyltransferase family 2 protein n=1 Tax=Telmatocola sphagniphila TaxID=1123043 RepID=A0A8E6EX67_9BACT|nr:glycosyltransferase family 2 protein [Telmatocola sphagniphila]QVL34765.1 glycosyltransferase family 2 protein [Telmatocola sphagniphila]
MDWVLLVLVIFVTVPLVVLASELFLSLIAKNRPSARLVAHRTSCAILVPAHNEEAGITKTIKSIQDQMRPGDRLVIVADNCADRTAEKARTTGCEVLERFDDINRGKGFALDFGMKHLLTAPPEIVVVIDADCGLHPGSLDVIVYQAERTNRPVQAVYLLNARPNASAKEQISNFAMLVKNRVRPYGLHQIGVPCLLTGTGMAFPWPMFRDAEHGTGNIVEDMKLGVDLALVGTPPLFEPDALVTSDPAPTSLATIKQRTRWEHGHVKTLTTQAPRLLLTGLKKFRASLVLLALDLAVPPVSLLLTTWAFMLVVCAAWWQLEGGWRILPIILTSAFGLNLVALAMVWLKFGRNTVKLITLAKIPWYIVSKIPIYLKLVVSPQKKWVRTDR